MITMFMTVLRKRYIFITIMIVIIIALSIILFTNIIAKPKSNSAYYPIPVEYDDASGVAYINGLSVQGLYQYSVSPNGDWMIYSFVLPGRGPDLYVYNRNTGDSKRITDHNWMVAFDPAINNVGDYAYAQNQYSTSASSIFLNGELVLKEESGRLGKAVALSENWLVFGVHHSSDNTATVYSRQISGGDIITASIDGFIKQIYYVKDDVFLLEVYGWETGSLDVWRYAAVTAELDVIHATEYTDIVGKIYSDGKYTINTILGHDDALYLFNAYAEFYDWQRVNPFSISNDFGGRISWNQSYRLEGLLELYNRTNDQKLLKSIQLAARNMLLVTNKYLGTSDENNPETLWASRKYSIDRLTPASNQANNGRILYSLMKCVTSGVLDEETSQDIINACVDSFDFYEQFYIGDGRYIFPKGSEMQEFDGVCLPFNQQNLYGLMLLELYQLTNEERYKQRCVEMAQYFRRQMIFADDGRILWHYWPDAFYDGWSVEDNISTNTPESKPTEDFLMEDFSHAGMNVQFILEFYRVFPEEVFLDSDIQAIKKTADALAAEGGFYPFLNGKAESIEPSFRYMPSYGWGRLGCVDIDIRHLRLGPYWLPDFDRQDILYAMASKIPPHYNDILTVETRTYSVDGSLAGKLETKDMTVEEYYR